MKITHLYDNIVQKKNLRSLWGYSVCLEINGRHLLMDTGSNGRVLLEHMRKLDVNAESIDFVFLSHPHWDHILGLDSVLELNPEANIVVPENLSSHLIMDLREMGFDVTVVGLKPHKIADGLYSTGTLDGGEPEQSLVVKSEKGLVVITGCAHPGLDKILQTCEDEFNEQIYAILGGFHLLKKESEEIETVISMLMEKRVKYVAPSHCTGNLALKHFQKAFGKNFIRAGAGEIYRF